MRPAIILVKPQLGENIGAAARAMANFNLTDLRIVAPRDGWPNAKAVEMATHGAAEIINNAKIFESFRSSVADLDYLYATTARPREMDKAVIGPKEIELSQKTGFVFGSERTGLSNEDIALCDKIISISVGEYKSLNLGMSVAVIAYEIFAGEKVSRQRELASKGEISALFEHLENELEEKGFFQELNKKPGMVANIRTMLSRAELSGQEVRSLRGIIKALVKPKN